MDKNKKDDIHVPGFVDKKSGRNDTKKVHKTDFVLPFAAPANVEEPVLSNPPVRKNNTKNGENKRRGYNTARSNSNSKRQYYAAKQKKASCRWNKKMAVLVVTPIFIILALAVCGRIAAPKQGANKYSDVSVRLPQDGNNTADVVGTVNAASDTIQFTTLPPYEKNNNVICLDAGHGGNDPGADRNKVYEKDQVLGITMLVKEYLEAEGYEVVLTRDSDMSVSLEDRVSIAEAANAGVLVSIHRNYYQPGALASGVECWIHNSNPRDAQKLAGMIMSEIDKLELSNNRGIKTGTIENPNQNYKVNTSKCTSCILELGFITNSKDDALVISSRSKCAKAIADGISRYIKSIK